MTRVFQHPLARHPLVGSLLSLLDAGSGGQTSAAMAVEVWIQRYLALQRFLRSVEVMLPTELTVRPGARLEPAGVMLPERYVLSPEELLGGFRPSRTDALGTDEALRIAAALRAGGPAAVGWDPRDVRLRRLARTGVWPDPWGGRFIARLDADVPAAAYTATPALVRALCGRAAWTEARVVARRLGGAERLVASRSLLRARVQAGLPNHEEDLSATMRAHLAQLRAEAAFDAGDLEGARRWWSELSSPHLRTLAAAVLLKRALEVHASPDEVQFWAAHLDPTTGEGLEARAALHAHQHAWRWAAADLYSAARTPRRSNVHWLEGQRPDARLTVALVGVTLRARCGFRWPWARGAWLREPEVLRRVVAAVGRSAATDPDAVAGLGGARVAQGLRHEAELLRLEAIDWDPLVRRAGRDPEAQAFVRGLLRDEAFGRTLPREPSDPLRAFFEDGLVRAGPQPSLLVRVASGHASPRPHPLIRSRPWRVPVAARGRVRRRARSSGGPRRPQQRAP